MRSEPNSTSHLADRLTTDSAHQEIPASPRQQRPPLQAGAQPSRKGVPPAQLFVGREKDMAVLRATLQEARSGHTKLVLIAGDPGIGKTRLAEEFAVEARAAGFAVRAGRCWEGKGAPTFWPWVQILRAHFQAWDATAIAAELGSSPDLLRLIPELRRFVPAEGSTLNHHLTPEESQFRLFDGFGNFLKTASRARPLLLVIDDLQCADHASLLLLRFLAAEMRDSHLLMIGTYRDAEPQPRPGFVAGLADLQQHPSTLTLDLHGLSEVDVGRLVSASAGSIACGSLVRMITDKTSGNAFFIQEIVRLLASEDRLATFDAQSHLPIPRTIRDVVTVRLGRLSEDCRNSLSAASVIGPEFDTRVLASACGRTPESSLAVLGEAIEARLIGEGRAPTRYQFSHPLVQELLYDGLPSLERRRLHGQVAAAIEELGYGDPDTHLSILAHHFFHALPIGDTRKAIAYSQSAGQHALRLLGYDDAARHFANAIEAAESISVSPAEHCELLLQLAEAQKKAGAVPPARCNLKRVARLATDSSNPLLLARAALGMCDPWREPGVVDEARVCLLKEALAVVDASAETLRVQLLAQLAAALYGSRDSNGAAALTTQAINMARRAGDPTAQLLALDAHHQALRESSDLERRMAVASEILVLSQREGHAEMALRAHMMRWCDQLEMGDLSAADDEIERAQRLVSELRQPRYTWQVRATRAMRALMEGRFAWAERLSTEAWAIGRRCHVPLADQFFWSQLAVLRRDQGGLQELAEPVEQLVQRYPGVPAWMSVLATIYVEMDRQPEARSLFESLAQNDFANIPQDFLRVITLCLAAELSSFFRDRTRAETLYQALLPFSGRNVVVGGGAVCDGSAARYLGLLAGTTERWDKVEEHFEEAMRMNSRLRARPLIARSQFTYAQVLLRRARHGDLAAAHDLLASAAQIAQSIGMHRLLSQIRELQGGTTLQAQGTTRTPTESGRRAPGETSAAQGMFHVFRSEGQYWTVAYQGVTTQLKGSKGLQYIAFLLKHAGQDIHVLDLAAGEVSPRPRARDGDLGPLLDRKARGEYKARLADLREDLEEAERHNDSGRATRLREEIDAITEQLAAALGIGGRDRHPGSATERARTRVRNNIANALDRIRKHNPPLGKHLAKSIKTGWTCRYAPEQPIHWDL